MRDIGIIVFLIFLLLVTNCFSFDVKIFLYPNENIGMVTYENFIQDNNSYSIVKINGKETILLKIGTPLINENDIKTILYAYYKSKGYPTQSELDTLIKMLKDYNASRFDGEAGEENYCLDVLHISGRDIIDNKPVQCIDNTTCEFAAKLGYSIYKKYNLFKDWQDALSKIKPYGLASHGTTVILKTSVEKLQNISEENIYNSLKYINDSIPSLKKYKNDIETSVLRAPNKNEKCNPDVCMGLCPPLDLNDSILASLESNISILTSKITPFGNYKAISAYIANSSKERLEFHVSENKVAYYKSVFEPLYNESIKVIQDVNEQSSRIYNSSLKIKVDIVITLSEKINKSIRNKSFAMIDSDIEEYKDLINKIKQGTETTEVLYNQSLSAIGNATAVIIVLETKEVGGDDALKLADIINKSNTLSKKFSAGLSVEEHGALISNYTLLSEELNTIKKSIKESPVSTVMNNFKLASYRIADNIFNAIKTTKILPEDQIPQNRFYILAGFSALVFISLSSLLILVVTIRLVSKSISTIRLTIYTIGAIAVIILFIIFSGLLYYFMDKATTTNDVEAWLGNFWSSEKDVSIVLNFSNNVSKSAINAMTSCASSLSSAIQHSSANTFNKNISVYQFSGSCIPETISIINLTTTCSKSCIIGIGNKTLSSNETECLAAMNDSEMITFSYSSLENKVKFPGILEKEVFASGDTTWYTTCAIANVFSG